MGRKALRLSPTVPPDQTTLDLTLDQTVPHRPRFDTADPRSEDCRRARSSIMSSFYHWRCAETRARAAPVPAKYQPPRCLVMHSEA
ncbi:hypothetical protein PG994_012682 [Apiospora phragmitis]|uniref:Uncharacterized protein n=1 Tax=Apiospora phragmitis TaxID=2905665 RepID=A0ABR1TB54_9PEZI